MRKSKLLWTAAVVAVSGLIGGMDQAVFGDSAQQPGDILGGSPIIAVLPKDGIPAIDDPRFVSVKEADPAMRPDEPVLGVTDGRVSKAYSLWQLNHHEIVNDWIGDVPIAVTW